MHHLVVAATTTGRVVVAVVVLVMVNVLKAFNEIEMEMTVADDFGPHLKVGR